MGFAQDVDAGLQGMAMATVWCTVRQADVHAIELFGGEHFFMRRKPARRPTAP